MEIHGSCKYDFNAVRALNQVSIFKRRKPLGRLLFFATCFLIVTSVHLFFVYRFGDHVLQQCWYVMIFLCVFEFYLYFLLPRISFRNMKNMKETENHYIFHSDRFSISSSLNGYSGQATMEYSMLVKVYETSRYFFIFQTRNQAYIVDKSTIAAEGALEIRSRLSSALGKKYFICRY